MIWSMDTILLVNIIIVLASILQMVTGVSVGMIIVPLLAMISYSLIPVPIIFASLALTVMMAYKNRDFIDVKNSYQISVGMLGGILIAVFILNIIHTQYLGVVYGVFILISVYISLQIKELKLTKSISYTGGLVAGIMGATSAVGGQILALIFANHPLNSLKGTLAFLYTLFSIAMLGIFYLFDDLSYLDIISGFYMMPGFIIGFFISPLFVNYFNPKYSKIVVLIMATIGAVLLITKSLSME
jgi:uncharacterized membrane protein YfcA